MNTTLSGCQALEGCEKKQDCLRYQIYRDSNGYQGWSAHQQCRVSAFTENLYPFFIRILRERPRPSGRGGCQCLP